MAKNAVNAVEQVASETGYKGEEKLEQARTKIRAELSKYNISMTDKDLDTFVESAVKQMNDAWKRRVNMGLNFETAIAWMRARKGQVSYSMDDRNGPDSYDCSSSIYYALWSGGAVSAGWAVNTEYEHDWLKRTDMNSRREYSMGCKTWRRLHLGGAVAILAELVAILVFS